MNELIYLSFFAIIILYIGIRERTQMRRYLKRIPTRVLVNGIRGKSTVTRLVMGVMKEDGRRVAGKTTGTSPRLFYWDRAEEEEVIRSLQGPNISEQKHIVRKVARRKVEGLVTECMAVNPEYQRIFQEEFVQSTITIITNITEDHLDVMGPTVNEIAEAFSRTVPIDGYVVMPPSSFEKYFVKEAAKKGSRVVIADPSEVTEEMLKQFPYMTFAENVAIGFAVADLLGIDRETAFQGMLHAPIDPGAMVVHSFGKSGEAKAFFNGFAANDVTSTLNIWERIHEQYDPFQHKAVIMNCRDDRVDRTMQFVKNVLPELKVDTLILTGTLVDPAVKAYEAGKLPVKSLINLEKQSAERVKEVVVDLPDNAMIFGIGNIHGGGEEIAEAISSLPLEQSKEPSEVGSY